jgi:RNA polymerase sigma factor (sigma-70 family)
VSDLHARNSDRSEPKGSAPTSGDDRRSHLISLHIALVKGQDAEGMTLLWERYIAMLLRYVASQCRTMPRLGAGAEDLAAEAFASFWKRASTGKFPGLVDREGLWKVLRTIARRKVARRARDENRIKRGGRAAFVPTDAATAFEDEDRAALEGLESREPSPADVAIVSEILAAAHDALPDPSLRDVLDLLLQEGYTQPEIARALGCSLTTVGRRVAEIRARLSALADKDEVEEI